MWLIAHRTRFGFESREMGWTIGRRSGPGHYETTVRDSPMDELKLMYPSIVSNSMQAKVSSQDVFSAAYNKSPKEVLL